jgi:hypothetical protein
MKKITLSIACIAMLLLSCGQQSTGSWSNKKKKTTDLAIVVPTFDEELNTCDKLIAQYDELIDKTIAGDAEALHKLAIAQGKIEKQMEILQLHFLDFTDAQAKRFDDIQKRFAKVAGRIK